MVKEKAKLFLIVMFCFILSFNLISSQMLLSEKNVKYDSEILDAFDESNWVEVIIDLRNISEKDVLFSTFSNNEIQKISEWSYSSRVNVLITKNAFDNLIDDSRVKSIYYDFPVQASDKKVGIGFPPIPNLNNGGLDKKIFFVFGFIVALITFFIFFFLIKLRRRYFAYNKKK